MIYLLKKKGRRANARLPIIQLLRKKESA